MGNLQSDVELAPLEPWLQSSQVPALRLRRLNIQAVAPQRDWVLYWMTAFRRTRSNYALQTARDMARQLRKPLVIFEALRVRYRWASDRFHRFVIEGMCDNLADCEGKDVLYYPYVEPEPGAGSGLLHALSERACVVVTDDYPCFFHPRMLQLVSRNLPAALTAVDANGLMPLQAAERTFTVAHSYRRWMQKELPRHLEHPPEDSPLDRRSTRQLPVLDKLPLALRQRWPQADLQQLLGEQGLRHLPIDHTVTAGAMRGGAHCAAQFLDRFVNQRLQHYATARNEPDELGASELSPHLHFGHIGPHEIFFAIMKKVAWNPSRLRKPNGKLHGFWGVDEHVEAFLDQLCTWREIGFNMCWREPDYDQFHSLPDWAQKTIAEHAQDPRQTIYTYRELEQARTHDEIWNAAQRQLVREGRIHNYLRMLWGKKIIQWTPSAQEALRIMIELNNKFALDGRDPNSYSGIFWVLGRYDRAWGPEREVFGKLRYMTSENTAKKHALKNYLKRFSVD
jgi:deoxyribodipyrimidine photo-lyase